MKILNLILYPVSHLLANLIIGPIYISVVALSVVWGVLLRLDDDEMLQKQKIREVGDNRVLNPLCREVSCQSAKAILTQSVALVRHVGI